MFKLWSSGCAKVEATGKKVVDRHVHQPDAGAKRSGRWPSKLLSGRGSMAEASTPCVAAPAIRRGCGPAGCLYPRVHAFAPAAAGVAVTAALGLALLIPASLVRLSSSALMATTAELPDIDNAAITGDRVKG
jgi:hypothetical protein